MRNIEKIQKLLWSKHCMLFKTVYEMLVAFVIDILYHQNIKINVISGVRKTAKMAEHMLCMQKPQFYPWHHVVPPNTARGEPGTVS